ncbi:MAG TPA: hypothetical protein VFS71_07530 [Flavobacterium sp.]|uniref:hypothetical protein n=1 Tax=Flavobacterium sp. TaxID=239 RepID=UPI002DBB46C0|nr:hypothetical protein [Flavobacterium sp.]HEU4789519.1 hypothetical protein [Flavobacterium sp.]
MAILKKIKSATLVEVLVASVLIVIIFVIASLVLNNLILNTFSQNTHPIEYRLNELEYKLENGMLKLPYQENYRGWDIEVKIEKKDLKEGLKILATNGSTKEIIRQRSYVRK